MHRISPYRDGKKIAGRIGGMRQDGTLYRALPFRKDGRLFFRRLHEGAPNQYDIALGTPYRQPVTQDNPGILYARSLGIYVNPRVDCTGLINARVYGLVEFGSFGAFRQRWETWSQSTSSKTHTKGKAQMAFPGGSIYVTNSGSQCDWQYSESARGYIKSVQHICGEMPVVQEQPRQRGSGYTFYEEETRSMFMGNECLRQNKYAVVSGGEIALEAKTYGTIGPGPEIKIGLTTSYVVEFGGFFYLGSYPTATAIYNHVGYENERYILELTEFSTSPQSNEFLWPPVEPRPEDGITGYRGEKTENNIQAPLRIYFSFPTNGHEQLSHYWRDL